MPSQKNPYWIFFFDLLQLLSTQIQDSIDSFQWRIATLAIQAVGQSVCWLVGWSVTNQMCDNIFIW